MPMPGWLAGLYEATGMEENAAECEGLVFSGTPRKCKLLMENAYGLGKAELSVLSANYLGMHYATGR